MKPKICVVGLGYIGLPTASLLAMKGYDVAGVEARPEVVESLNKGETLIHEPGLDAMVRAATGSGRLKASATPEKADIFILALPTPFKENKKPDLDFVRAGVEEIAPYLEPGNMVILESTSPAGTTAKIAAWLKELRPDLNYPDSQEGEGERIYLAHCPERVLPGRILRELVENDRIVGGLDAASTEKAVAFYRDFVEGAVLPASSSAAEMAKLAENSFRDVNIAFANELSLICDDLGIDAWEVIRLANRHPRVNILAPGAGVGGHCISVDPWFIVDAAPERARLIRAAREINDGKADWVADRVAKRAERFAKPVIACFGLAFKQDVDDLRESPALRIATALSDRPDWRVLVVEPNARELPEPLASRQNVERKDWRDALKEADILAFLVGHKEFKAIRARDLAERVVIDACGLLQANQ